MLELPKTSEWGELNKLTRNSKGEFPLACYLKTNLMEVYSFFTFHCFFNYYNIIYYCRYANSQVPLYLFELLVLLLYIYNDYWYFLFTQGLLSNRLKDVTMVALKSSWGNWFCVHIVRNWNGYFCTLLTLRCHAVFVIRVGICVFYFKWVCGWKALDKDGWS